MNAEQQALHDRFGYLPHPDDVARVDRRHRDAKHRAQLSGVWVKRDHDRECRLRELKEWAAERARTAPSPTTRG